MATQTYDPIASITLSAATASVTFSAIPQTYTDLVLVGNIKMTATSNYRYVLNSDTGANYSNTQVRGTGLTTNTQANSNLNYTFINTQSSTDLDNMFIINILDYSNTTTFKTQLLRYNNASAATNIRAALWRSTAAITSIKIESETSTFVVGSTFNLYGIKAGNA